MIQGKNIVLRTLRESDLDALFRLDNDLAEVGEFWPLRVYSMQELKAKYAETGCWGPDSGSMLITNREERLLGRIGYFKFIPYTETFEIGYKVFRAADRGQGVMSEALALFSAYLFAVKPVPRLTVCTIRGNQASCRVAEKAGYRHEGTLRRAIFHHGAYADLDVFSLLREDCPPAGVWPTPK